MLAKNFKIIDLLLVIFFTVLGLLNKEVTVFYIIYLFWFQELIRTIIDRVVALRNRRVIPDAINNRVNQSGVFLLLFIYFVFILVFFGLMLNWRNQESLFLNLEVIFFKNWFFNGNLIFFTITYSVNRYYDKNEKIETHLFNPRQIILHVSIILGAIIQFFIVNKFNLDSFWGSLAVITPFLILKAFLDRVSN